MQITYHELKQCHILKWYSVMFCKAWVENAYVL